MSKLLQLLKNISRTSVNMGAVLVLILFSVITPQITEMSPQARAISECDLIAIEKGSILTDNEACVDPCVAPATEILARNDPGAVFVLGDSIGLGVTPPLSTLLTSGDGWGVTGDSLEGRSLSQGISVANSNPDGLSSAKHILVILGTNNLGNNTNQANVTEMMRVLKEKNSGATIHWLKVNVTEPSLVDLMEPYNQILASSGAQLIDNTAEISGDKIHPANYSELANIVATSIKGTGGSGGPESDAAERAAALSAQNNQPERTSNLDLRAKLAMLLYVRANTESQIQTAVGKGVGGIFVRPGDANNTSVYNSIKGAVGSQKILIGVDFEGGRVQAPGPDITGDVPSAREMGQMSGEEIKAIAKEKGEQLAALGINVDFAPVIDIGGRNNDVIGDRAFGNDPTTVVAKAGAFSSGLSESNVISTLKHFPGHGSSEGDSHNAPVRTKSLAELEARDIKPFLDMSTREKTIIMMGHLLVPDWGSQATSLNPQAYQYLRQVINYDGVVVTDALDMGGIPSPSDQPGRSLAAIQAGADMALITDVNQIDPTVDQLEFAVANGSLSQERVDEAVSRIIQLRDNIDAAPTTTPQIDCAPCSVSGSVPIDGENPKRAFQYFLSVGYKAEWAAGIVGNMVAESGVEPQRLQGTPGGTVTPASQAVGSSLGWGLVQWTPAGKYINAVGVDKADDFAVQLDFVYQQLEGQGPLKETAAGKDLKTTTTPEDAAASFMLKFERPKDQSAPAVAKRGELARSVYDQYQGVSAGAVPVGTGGGASCTQSSDATIVGDLAWPVDVRFWNENPEWFTKPHHDYPASDIPVPTGTKIYSLTSGKVKFITEGYGGGCGTGVAIESGASVVSYCHGIPGTLKVQPGQDVKAGDVLFDSDNTGSSSGPHLHIAIKVDGVKHCPQQVFEQMGAGKTSIDFSALPTSGCTN